MTKKGVWVIVGVLAVLGLLLGSFGCTTAAPEVTPTPTPTPTPTKPTKSVTIAVLSQFSGTFAKWGNAELHAMEVEADRVNAAGGLELTDAYYMIEPLGFDDKGFTPAEMLKGAKQAVLEHDAKLLITSVSSWYNETLGPFAQETQTLALIWGGVYFNPKWEYCIGGESGWPYYQIVPPTEYLAKNHPEVKRAAVIDTDFALGEMTRVWSRIGVQAVGMEVVYDKLYPVETVDFYPIMTDIMKSNPDVIIEGAMPVSHLPPIMKAAKDLGYEGYWICTTADAKEITEAVGKDYASRVFIGSTEWGAPTAPAATRWLHDESEKRWPGEWDNFAFESYVNMLLWEMGVKWADSVDPTAVRDALLAHDPIEHPIFGTSPWWGEKLYGKKMQLGTPIFLTVIQDGVPTVLPELYSFADWWEQPGVWEMVYEELLKAEQLPPGSTLPAIYGK